MVYNMLYDWQKKICDAITMPSFGLFLDCGCGKTPVSLGLAEFRKCEKILVITLNSKATETVDIKGSWHDWSTKLDNGDFAIHEKKEKSPQFGEKDVYIVNYDSLYVREKSESTDKRKKPLKLRPPLLDFIASCEGKPSCIICDESHKLKDASTNISKSVDLILAKMKAVAKRVTMLLLSGTPFTTGYIDLWNQLRLLGCPMKKQEFKDKFCEMGHFKRLAAWQQPIVGYKNLDELYRLTHLYSITIKSEDVVKLPDAFHVDYPLPPSEFFKILTKPYLKEPEFVAHNGRLARMGLSLIDIESAPMKSKNLYYNPWYRNIDYPEEDFVCDTPALLWMRARQLSIGFQGNGEKYRWYDRSRLERFKEFMEDYPDNYVVFYNYVPEFNELFWICDKLGYNIDVYNGEIKSLYFYDLYEKQTENQRIANRKNIILANFATGSTGKNWQNYNKCVLFSIPLYKDWEQGLKRVLRIGSTEPVTYYHFFSDNWLDNDMRSALDSGIQYSQDMFNKALNKVYFSVEHP